jgi:hypothetical protein
MNKRIQRMYIELYKRPCTKQYFSELFDITSKTIENTIKTVDEIIYDKQIGAYRFIDLLPKYIPCETFLTLFQDTISNELIKNDFSNILSKLTIDTTMISTNSLSPLGKKIIKATIAINYSCILKMEYKGNVKILETKYIRPHKILSTDSTYYLIASYDEKNEKNISEMRTCALNGIYYFEALEYVKNDNFKIDRSANAYGFISKDKYLTLKLEEISANFFKREGFFNKGNFDFLSEEVDGTIFVKMYYNNIEEVVRLLQTWMPQITLIEDSTVTHEIYDRIELNHSNLKLNRGNLK